MRIVKVMAGYCDEKEKCGENFSNLTALLMNRINVRGNRL